MAILSGTPHTVDMRAALTEELGLDDPLPIQYGRWLASVVSGDFGGRSLETREPIRSIIARQLPVTLLLASYAVLLSIVISVPLGILSALRRNRTLDFIIRLTTLGGLSIPTVWAAHVVILVLLLVLRWSPPVLYSGVLVDARNHVQIMAWPALLLAWEYSSHLVRVIRSRMLDVLGQEYVTAARCRGLSEARVVVKYALRNALLPAVSMVGLQFGSLLGGALVVETIFGLPGLGRGLIQAAIARDHTVIQSFAALLVLLYLSVNTVIDVLSMAIDPRISDTM